MILKPKLLLAGLAGLLLIVCAPLIRAQAQTVTGKWHFVFQTEDGERTFDPDFQQQDEQVTGKWGKSDVKGTFAGGKLDLAFPYNSDEVGPGTLKIKGELKGETLTGTWGFQEYSGNFKATRAPAAAP
jgi:hypothetical protein